MIQIICEQQYKTTLWKNGKGETTELAISENSTLDNFNWRLSIASVSENGLFSNFAGLFRHLILLTGNGIELLHQSPVTKKNTEDRLEEKLSIARFDGSYVTQGNLLNGPITDFNIMHNPSTHSAKVVSHQTQITQALEHAEQVFVYSRDHQMTLTDNFNKIVHIEPNQLLSIRNEKDNSYTISGQQLIIIYLNGKA